MSAVQSVDADAFGKVETHGIDAIPAAERHGRPRELGFLWAGAFTNYASLRSEERRVGKECRSRWSPYH